MKIGNKEFGECPQCGKPLIKKPLFRKVDYQAYCAECLSCKYTSDMVKIKTPSMWSILREGRKLDRSIEDVTPKKGWFKMWNKL